MRRGYGFVYDMTRLLCDVPIKKLCYRQLLSKNSYKVSFLNLRQDTLMAHKRTVASVKFITYEPAATHLLT